MKLLIKLLIGMVGFLLFVFILAGLLIPAEKSFTDTTSIEATPETVWTVLRDVKSFPEWQDQVSSVEIENDDSWTEVTESAGPLRFKVVRAEKPTLLEIHYSSESGVKGEWLGELTSADGGKKTQLKTTDRSKVESWIAKVFMSMFFDLEEFAKDWNQKLKKRAEKLESERTGETEK